MTEKVLEKVVNSLGEPPSGFKHGGGKVSVLTILSSTPKKINFDGFSELLTKIFNEEAKRLNLPPLRYEYSNLNQMYKAEDPSLDNHYHVLYPGSPFQRALFSTLDSCIQREYDIHFPIIRRCVINHFKWLQTFYRNLVEDVEGIGSLHSFLTRTNRHLREYNLAVVYFRQIIEDSRKRYLGIEYIFHDRLGLVKGTFLHGLGKVASGKADLKPIKEIKRNKIYYVEVANGYLIMSPLASTIWDHSIPRDWDETKNPKLYVDRLENKRVNTLHHLNGTTPHEMKNKLLKCFRAIVNYEQQKTH